MHRIPLATGLISVLVLVPACSVPTAAGPSGTYKLDIQDAAKNIAMEMPKALAATLGKTDGALTKMLEGMVDAALVLNSDNTFSMAGKFPASNPKTAKLESLAFTSKGTWSIEDGTITLNQTHYNDEEQELSKFAKLKDGVLSFATERGNQKAPLRFNKL